MLEKLMGNPIAWGILSAIAIFTALFAVYTWVVGKKRKQLSVVCKTNEVIASGKSKIDKLRIEYDGKEIENLSVTKLYVWNSGNEVINKSDIVTSRPMCVISTGDAIILNAQVVRVSEEANAISIINQTPRKAELDYDYIDQGEGAVLQILHTGPAIDIEFDCKIKGGDEVRDLSDIKRKKKKRKGDGFFNYVLGVLPVVLMALFFYFAYLLSSLISQTAGLIKGIGIPISILLLIGGPVLGVWIGLKTQKAINKKLRRSIPDSLNG